MASTPNQPYTGAQWTQVVIYCGIRAEPWWVELVAADDGEYCNKGDVIEAGVSPYVTGDPLLPTRQRNREAMVYSITFVPATNADKRHWHNAGLRSPVVRAAKWTMVHRRQIGTMPWWEAYSLTVAGLSDTHMSAAQRQRLDPAFLEDERKPKSQRTLQF